MMQCKNKRAGTKETHGKTRNSWKSSEASVLGRYNTPPLREDLVPDLEWHRRDNEREKRRGKTKLLLRQMSETKEPCEVEQIERNDTTKISELRALRSKRKQGTP